MGLLLNMCLYTCRW